jgi:Transglycosylase SLT domain.
MVYNPLVKEQIDYFGTRWQPILKQMLSKSNLFFPLFEEILVEYNMPVEIKYLSVIESALNPHARSRSGAVGAWQFMPATARIFDLDINYKVDERRSLEKVPVRLVCTFVKCMINTVIGCSL